MLKRKRVAALVAALKEPSDDKDVIREVCSAANDVVNSSPVIDEPLAEAVFSRVLAAVNCAVHPYKSIVSEVDPALARHVKRTPAVYVGDFAPARPGGVTSALTEAVKQVAAADDVALARERLERIDSKLPEWRKESLSREEHMTRHYGGVIRDFNNGQLTALLTACLDVLYN